MENIHIHLGSWKSASSLVQATLRKNKNVLSNNGAFFVDQNTDQHKDFSKQFRKAMELVSEYGICSSLAQLHCQKAANYFEELNESSTVTKFIHSWENFVGHPFYRNPRVLYHGVATAWWFEQYLSHLPLEFTFITRNQADLIEAMYTQEVRKGRFLGGVDEFIEKFLTGRDLSWLPVVEPFVSRFGYKRVRVIPFEDIKECGSEKFLRKFFSPIFDFDLDFSVKHSNPSFSAEAVKVALKTYPGLDAEERKKEELRLVKEYSNLKYPRSDFLEESRRSYFLETVRHDNRVLFDDIISPDYERCFQYYKPEGKVSYNSKGGWIDSLLKKNKGEEKSFLSVIDLNGQEEVVPLFSVDDDLKHLLPVKYKDKTILSSKRVFSYPFPKGSEVGVKLSPASSEQLDLAGCVTLDLMEVINSSVGSTFSVVLNGKDRVSLVKGNPKVRYAAVLVVDEQRSGLMECGFKLEASGHQLLPTHVKFTQDGFLPSKNGQVTPGYDKSFLAIPNKINSFEGLANVESVESYRGTVAPTPFFLTIDTESIYFDRPSMMTGEGLEGAKASYEILDELDKNNLKAVFYVNVFEHLQYNDDSVERLCKSIHERGHEIALHSHKSKSLGFYDKEIDECSYDEQCRILEYGKNLIYRWLGREVVNFRAGAYRHNDDTLIALQNLGFKIDSSFFYSRNNSSSHERKLVRPYKVGSLIEVPILYQPVVMQNGVISNKKYDVNPLTLKELKAVVDNGGDLSVINFMMHSFSFIKRKRFSPDQKVDGLLMRNRSRGRYMGVTGLDERLWNDFCLFLNWLANNKNINVTTMEGSLSELNSIASYHSREEVLPFLYR